MRFTLAFLLMLLLAVVPVFADDEAKEGAEEDTSPFQAKTFKGLKLRSIGPALMSGRIGDLAVHRQDNPSTLLRRRLQREDLWKTDNERRHDLEARYSTDQGSLLDRMHARWIPTIRTSIWVGTGENVNSQRIGRRSATACTSRSQRR